MATVDEKRITLKNNSADVLEAKVIANYGDPGLDEDYQFDILSRYVIVEIESCDRVITNDKVASMIVAVQRPTNLWIQPEGGVASSPSSQKRSDAAGNVSTGLAGNFTVNGIARINNAYAFGEIIKIKKLASPFLINQNGVDPIFQSAFAAMPSTQVFYNTWHSQGATLPYIINANNTNSLRLKTIAPSTLYPGYYFPVLNKYQYEAFMLTLNQNSSTMIGVLTQIFNGTWNGQAQVYSANGGYVYQGTVVTLPLPIIHFVDININGKQRTNNNDCMPLIVAAPHTFPTPKVRATGTIQFNPQVATIVQS